MEARLANINARRAGRWYGRVESVRRLETGRWMYVQPVRYTLKRKSDGSLLSFDAYETLSGRDADDSYCFIQGVPYCLKDGKLTSDRTECVGIYQPQIKFKEWQEDPKLKGRAFSFPCTELTCLMNNRGAEHLEVVSAEYSKLDKFWDADYARYVFGQELTLVVKDVVRDAYYRLPELVLITNRKESRVAIRLNGRDPVRNWAEDCLSSRMFNARAYAVKPLKKRRSRRKND